MKIRENEDLVILRLDLETTCVQNNKKSGDDTYSDQTQLWKGMKIKTKHVVMGVYKVLLDLLSLQLLIRRETKIVIFGRTNFKRPGKIESRGHI